MTTSEVTPRSAPQVGAGIKHLVPDGWHLTADVAPLVERSKDTVERWRKTGAFEPSGFMTVGQLTIPLYSDDDIKDLRVFAANIKTGRKPKEA